MLPLSVICYGDLSWQDNLLWRPRDSRTLGRQDSGRCRLCTQDRSCQENTIYTPMSSSHCPIRTKTSCPPISLLSFTINLSTPPSFHSLFSLSHSFSRSAHTIAHGNFGSKSNSANGVGKSDGLKSETALLEGGGDTRSRPEAGCEEI